MLKTFVLLCCTLVTAAAADFTGTWKLNLTKSKYEGMPAPKEQTVTYTPKGTGYEYMAMGTTATGQPIHSMFSYSKDGGEVKTTGFPFWDAMVIKDGMTAKTAVQYKRDGKVVGSSTRMLAANGKSLTITGQMTMPDGKKATFMAFYDKQ